MMEQNPAHPGTPGSSPSPRRCHTAEAAGRASSEESGLSLNRCRVPLCPRSPIRGAGDAAPGDGGAGGCCPLLPGVQSPAKGNGAHRAASPSREPAEGPESSQSSLSAPLYSSRGTHGSPTAIQDPLPTTCTSLCVAQPAEPTAKPREGSSDSKTGTESAASTEKLPPILGFRRVHTQNIHIPSILHAHIGTVTDSKFSHSLKMPFES